MGPPLRRTWKQFLLFRRGRTLAGPREGQIPIPFVSLRSISPLDKGSQPPCRGKACGRPGVPPLRRGWKPSSHFVGAGHWPARRRGKSLSPLSRCARHLPLIRGVVPSPTSFKNIFRDWVGEALGPPAGGLASQESTLIRPRRGYLPPCRGKACGRPGVPPLRRGWKPSSHFVGAGHWPARIRGAPRSSRPTQKSALSSPPHPPQCAHWGTFPPGGRLAGG